MLMDIQRGVNINYMTMNIVMTNGVVFSNKDVVSMDGVPGYVSEYEKWVIYVEKHEDGLKMVHLNRDDVASFELNVPFEETNTD